MSFLNKYPCVNISAPTYLSFSTVSFTILSRVVASVGNFLVVLVVFLDPYKDLRSPFNYFVNSNTKFKNLILTGITLHRKLGDVRMTLDGKRWSFVSKRLSQQHVMKRSFETHRKLLGALYSKLRNFVEHMFSVYIEFVSTVAEDVKRDRKAHLTLRWMNTKIGYLEGSSQNSMACTPVFTDLSSKHSSATIRAVIGIFHSRGLNSGLFHVLGNSTAGISSMDSMYTEDMCSTRFRCSL